MKRASSTGLMLEVSDKDATKQLAMYNAVRQGIISGAIAPAQRLPSTRDFANAYSISRGTAVIVYDLLQSEGYVVSRPGAGTFAADSLPDVRMNVSRVVRAADMAPAPRWDSDESLSSVAREFVTAAALAPAMTTRPRPLTPSLPALDEFPVSLWARLCAKHSRLLKPELMGHAHPAGIPKLRAALAQHLRLTRGIDCAPEQVLLTASTGQALQLSARLLIEQGGKVAVEDPGHPDIGRLLRGAGFQVVPAPVDGEGVLPDACMAANLAHVSPAHHCATGVAMSPARRRTLVDAAAERGTWIFENDAGSEFRYHGHPTPALFSMSRGGGVIHAGSFDQTLFPALHISYLVVRWLSSACSNAPTPFMAGHRP
ncbi:MAG: PLP-dependent aminotransferase family protein [Ramlibacter sp.]|nr:PLP-dependent aminotransferase family protein [Ramlibacter sp.]